MKNEKLKDPRKRKMLLVLPLLIIPFLTMAFWALGGGNSDASTLRNSSPGLNLQLPNAQLKDDKGENKLSYYEEAEKDSVKWREGIENDPLFLTSLDDSVPLKSNPYNPYPLQAGDYKDPNEQKVYQKLAELNSHLQSSDSYNTPGQKLNTIFPSVHHSSMNREGIDRLEEMMNHVGSSSAKDSEVEQLNTMMDRILDIQHPERVKERLSENQNKSKEEVFDAHKMYDHFTISVLDTGRVTEDEQNAFYGMDNENGSKESNAIEAVIHQTQTLVDGSIVKMRLLDDVTIDNAVIPKGNFVFGKASLEGERLHIDINSIRKENAIYPVKLVVLDFDGMEGVHIPGAITRDVAKQSAGNSLQNIEMTAIDPSLKMQAANAGINAAKSLLTKKAKLVKVTVKAGYKILLREKTS